MIVDRKLTPGAALSGISRCRCIERHEGNLDIHYGRHRLVGLLDRLKADRPNHNVPVSGKVYRGTATLQSAVRLYNDFRDARAGVNLTQGPQNRRQQEPGSERSGAGRPVWGLKVDWGPFEFARQVTPFVQFLDPGINRAS